MNLSEAAIQVLATLGKCELEGGGTDRDALARQGERYRSFLEDWSSAFDELRDAGMIHDSDSGYGLTEKGRPTAHAMHRERLDHYWYYYRHFYTAARASAAHSRHCERVYGEDLCQEGQTDMAELGRILDLLDLPEGARVLDLGCGAGVISEHLSDRLGATVTGIDNADAAVAEARSRTADKRDRVSFLQGDLNALDLPARHYDAVIMIDSIYWAVDTARTIDTIAASLKTGGQMAIVVALYPGVGQVTDCLDIDGTDVAVALGRLGLDFDAHDLTDAFLPFWPRLKESMVALRGAFEAEGNGFICEEALREADEDFLPAIEAGTLRRFLYHVRV